MLNPISWSLDDWYTALQWGSFVILGLTVAIGVRLAGMQADEIRRLKTADIASQRALEVEKLGGKELLQAMAPRMVGYGAGIDPAATEKYFEPLKKLSGRLARIEYLQCAEPRRAAQSIADALEVAGWKVEGPAPNDELWQFVSDGVRVEWHPILDTDSKTRHEREESNVKGRQKCFLPAQTPPGLSSYI